MSAARPAIRDLPSPLAREGELAGLLAGRRPAVFLDYDGTLTPIVPDPAAATLPPATRTAIERLAARCPVAIVSGRDLEDVRGLVGVDGIAYAGSHGFDLRLPDGSREERGRAFLPALDRAEAALGPALAEIPGAAVERKRFAVAVHFRTVEPARRPDVEAAARDVAGASPGLRLTGGKRVLELRPDLDWDKGRALDWLLDELGLLRDDVAVVYVGDDVTDEDAFRVVEARGVGVLVRGRQGETTRARYVLEDPGEVRRFLAALADRMDAPRAPTDAASGRG